MARFSASSGWDRVVAAKYGRFGVDTAFTSPVEARTVTLRMIDLTKGVEVGTGFSQVATVTPAVAVRFSEMTALGIAPGDMMGVCFTLNGANWQIKSYSPKPGPFGQGVAEVYFMLEDADG